LEEKEPLTAKYAYATIAAMFETFFFLLGLGFSVLVYLISIRPRKERALRKFFYFLLTLIGITGSLFLFGVLVAYFLRKLGLMAPN
jgi:hypothetical protein